MSRQWSSQPCAWTSTWWPAGHPMWCPCDLLFKRLRLLTLECVRAVDKPRKCTVYISSLCGSHSRSLVTRLGIRFRSFELQISFAALFLSSNSLKLEKAAEAFLHYIEGSKESKFFLMAISDGKFYISIISQHTTHCLKTEKEAIFKMHSGKTHKSYVTSMNVYCERTPPPTAMYMYELLRFPIKSIDGWLLKIPQIICFLQMKYFLIHICGTWVES